MKLKPTPIQGLFVVTSPNSFDARGLFVKPYNREQFQSNGLACNFDETFYSTSKKNVLRGFHLQLPPHDSKKLVWVSNGSVLDVALDLRKESKTYGDCFSTELSSNNFKAMYIPEGVAHAFYVLGNEATVFYQVGKCYSAIADSGIKWDSAGFSWPCEYPTISDRDQELPKLNVFTSPF